MKKRRIQKKKKKIFSENKLLIFLGVFIILLMVGSMLNMYDEPDTTNVYEYQGLTFHKIDGGWLTNHQNGQTIILSHPKDLENITFEKISLNLLNNKEKIYLSINPLDKNQEALYDFQRNIQLIPRLVPACYKDNEPCTNKPLINCTDASPEIGVILIKEANETLIEVNNNCLRIEGKDLLKIINKLIIQQI